MNLFCNLNNQLLDGFVETEAFKNVYNKLAVVMSCKDASEKNCLIVLTGAAGIGKTTLAMSLLAQHSLSYDSAVTFVIRCDKKQHLIKDLSLLSAKLDNSFKNRKYNISFTVDGEVKISLSGGVDNQNRTLERCKISGAMIEVEESDLMTEMFTALSANLRHCVPWMILLDNVDIGNGKHLQTTGSVKNLVDTLRKCVPGIIIVTSRHQDFLTYLQNNSNLTFIHVNLEDKTYRVSYEQATQIFFGKNDFRNMDTLYGSKEDLNDLIERLSFIPLAVRIAGIYIQEENISYVKYRQLLKNEAEDIDKMHRIVLHDVSCFLDTGFDKTDAFVKTQRSVIQMSVKRIIQSMHECDRGNILLLLCFCAFLDSDNIPMGMVKKVAKKLTKKNVLFMSFKNSLIRYSLIQTHWLFLSIHREVQWVLKWFCLKKNIEAINFEVLIAISAEAFEAYHRPISSIMPHIASFHTNCNRLQLDRKLHNMLQTSSGKINARLNAQVQRRARAMAEQLQTQWTQTVLLEETLEHQNDDEVRSKAQLAAAQSSHNFQLPPRNKQFVGREMLLEELETKFVRLAQTNQCSIVAVVGSGGMGKSALTLAYIYRSLSKKWYKRAIWLNAEFSHHLLMQVQSLVKQWYVLEVEDTKSLKETDYIRRFYNYLTDQMDGNTCIVLDNAGIFSSIEMYLPEGNKRNKKLDVFITSRYVEWTAKFKQSFVMIQQFSTDDVKKYFLMELPSVSITYTEIEKLTSLLGGLPLAVVQATAYIKQNNSDITTYIKLFKKQPVRYIMSDDENTLTVQHTLTLAIGQVRRKNSSVDAVVSICAYLAADHITKELLYMILGQSLRLGSLLAILQELDATQTSTDRAQLRQLSELLKQTAQTLQASNVTDSANKNGKANGKDSGTADRSLNNAAADLINLEEVSHKTYFSCEKPHTETHVERQCQLMNDGTDTFEEVAQTEAQERPYPKLAPNEQENRFQKAKAAIENTLKGASQCKYVASRQSIDRALMLLEQYSVVTVQDCSVRIHRLTQAVMREIHTNCGLYKRTYIEVLQYLLRELDYDEKDRTDILRVSGLIPHGLHLQQLEHQFLMETDPTEPYQLWWKIGYHQLFGVENPIIAIKCYKKTLQIKSEQYGHEHPDVAAILNNLATAYGDQGNYEKQHELLTRALAIEEAHLGPNHPETSITLTNLGNAYCHLGDYEKQRDLLTRALVIKEKHFGPNHPETSITLTNLGNAYGHLGNYEKQQDLLTRALELDEAHFGADHPRLSITLESLSNLYGDLGNYLKQRELLTRALAIKKAHFGPDHLQTNITLSSLGNVYGLLGDYQKQQDLLERALEFFQVRFGPNHPQTSIVLTNLGNAYSQLGSYEKQRDVLACALAIDEVRFGANHPRTSITLGSLGIAYGYLGNYEKQRDLLTRALTIQELHFGLDHPQTSKTLTNLGNAFGHLGNYEKQRDFLTRALAIDEAHYGSDHPETSITLTNLADAVSHFKDYNKQRDLLTRALAIDEAHFGHDHPRTIITLGSLGNAYGNLGDYAKQQELLAYSLAIKEEHFGHDHPQTSITLVNLGNAYGRQGDYKKQRDLLNRALAIQETHFGADHLQTSITLTNLGLAYGRLGDHEKQRDMLSRALVIKEKHFGSEHRQTASAMHNLSGVCVTLGDLSTARQLAQCAVRTFQSLFGESHPDCRKAAQRLRKIDMLNAVDRISSAD